MAARGAKPRCSIVIPVHGRAALTRQCLEAILSDPPRASFELVVVDDASTDGTAELLAGYGKPVRVVTRSKNGGFAKACNDGAAHAAADRLVFLNNDTIPQSGWLDALVEHAGRRQRTAVVGSKLLFPNDTIQHAGVVICQDGLPRHLYAGFPADHPAVNVSRRFQAVTAACMLVRRAAFEQAGGFDTVFRNSLEDADLCLRIGQQGGEVHYCHASVLHHLESASRGKRSQETVRNTRLFLERWSERAERDDIRYYLEDGLIRFGYRDSWPLEMEVSPLLAGLPAGPRHAGRMIDLQAEQVAGLLRETVRLTAQVAELDYESAKAPSASRKAVDGAAIPLGAADELARDAGRLELEIYDYQARVAAAVRGQERRRGSRPFEPGEALRYRGLKTRLRELVEHEVPAAATVLVVTRGDEDLLELGGRRGRHFPEDAHGRYTGHHPKDSQEAIDRLERMREAGAGYLLVPATAAWWMKHYRKFAGHLNTRYDLLVSEQDTGLLFRLDGGNE